MKCVFISCFNAYDNRIAHIEKVFEGKGYEPVYITSNYNHEKKTFYKFEQDNTIQINTLSYEKNFSLRRLLSHFLFSWRALKEVKKSKPDILYVMVPPNSLAYFASKYAKKNNIKLIFDVYDLWPETFPSDKFKSIIFYPFKLWGNLRNKNLKNADVVVTECNLFKLKLESYFDQAKSITLYPSKKANDEANTYIHDNNKINLCYLGSINNIIDIDLISTLLAYINKIKPVTLHIIGDGESRNKFINSVKEQDIDVIYYGRIYDDSRKREVFDKCMLGINIMKNSVCIGLTLKSIDYLHGGLPILNNIKADTFDLVKENDIGINLDENLKKTAEMIASLSNHEIIQMRENTKEIYKRVFSLEAFELKVDEIFTELNITNECYY